MNTYDEKPQDNMMNESENTQLINNEDTAILPPAGDETTEVFENDEMTKPLFNEDTVTYDLPDEKPQGNNHKAAKIAAAAVAGAAVAGGSAYAAVRLLNDDDKKVAETTDAEAEEEETAEGEEPKTEGEEPRTEGESTQNGEELDYSNGARPHTSGASATAEHSNAAAAHSNAAAAHSEGHHTASSHQPAITPNAHHEQGTTHHTTTHTSEPHISAARVTESADHSFDIESINAVAVAEDEVVIDVEARYDGHNARFLADSDGRLIAGGVDVDGNGELTEDEVVDLSESGATINDLKALDNVAGNDYLHEVVNIIDEPAEQTFDVISAEVDLENDMIEIGARYNGNEARFLADGEGNLLIGAVDENGDGEISEDEIMDFTDTDATIDDLVALDNVDGEIDAVYYADYNDYQDNDDDIEVQVIGVGEDLDVDGHLVDAAAVLYDEEPMILIDASQNGEIDVIVADVDGNGEISDDEYFVVTDQHLSMPGVGDWGDPEGGSYDDPYGDDFYQAANYTDDYADYNNDANVNMYDA